MEQATTEVFPKSCNLQMFKLGIIRFPLHFIVRDAGLTGSVWQSMTLSANVNIKKVSSKKIFGRPGSQKIITDQVCIKLVLTNIIKRE